eukprot:Hpha_TRINITY_DN16104_c0_g2::TRINITY_DN16104_c0_g2_i1::g.6656::m.6656/K09592/EGLN, HPH; hypoxia-inducible factor prolyl hydroxylase
MAAVEPMAAVGHERDRVSACNSDLRDDNVLGNEDLITVDQAREVISEGNGVKDTEAMSRMAEEQQPPAAVAGVKVKVKRWVQRRAKRLTPEEVGAELQEQGYSVLDGWLEDACPGTVRELADYARAQRDSGRMDAGQTGGQWEGFAATPANPVVRGDLVCWEATDVQPPCVGRLCEAVSSLAVAAAGVAGDRSPLMISCYPRGGARYASHIDNPNGNGRLLTAIVYLTKGWKAGDGGELRLAGPKHQAVIAPLLGRLLLFWSDARCPHEVLPTGGRDRYAGTLWFYDPKELGAYTERLAEAWRR